MTTREINARIRHGKTVTATYEVCGVKTYGRIIRARIQHGQLQGMVLAIGKWFNITDPQVVL